MNFADIRLKIRKFIKKYKKLLIILLIWLAIFIVNFMLKNKKTPDVPSTTYEPNKTVMDNEEVPQKLQEPINELIGKYVEYCNAKDYENAYNLIEESCRKNVYPDFETYKKQIDTIFNGYKIYNIQSYSIVGDDYIYNVRILEDILATGMTDSGYSYYEDKFVIKNTKNGLKLCLGGYIGEYELDSVAEEQYLKFNCLSKVVKYDSETYEIKVTNRSEYPIVLYDGSGQQEVTLNIGDQERNVSYTDYSVVVLQPKQTRTFKFEFTKYYDDGRTAQKINFNSIRVLNSYQEYQANKEEALKNAVKLYGLEIDLKS